MSSLDTISKMTVLEKRNRVLGSDDDTLTGRRAVPVRTGNNH